MKKIITKEGKEVLVDDEDFEYLREFAKTNKDLGLLD